MKKFTITAIVAFLIGIPFVYRHMKEVSEVSGSDSNPRFADDNHLYDIDELLT